MFYLEYRRKEYQKSYSTIFNSIQHNERNYQFFHFHKSSRLTIFSIPHSLSLSLQLLYSTVNVAALAELSVFTFQPHRCNASHYYLARHQHLSLHSISRTKLLFLCTNVVTDDGFIFMKKWTP